MRQPSDIVAAVTIYPRFSTGLLECLCSDSDSLLTSHTLSLARRKDGPPHNRWEREGQDWKLLYCLWQIWGSKPAKINWIFRWAWPSPYLIYHSQRSRAKWAFSLFPLGALLLRVQYLAWVRESTLAVTCVYIWTTVDQEGIRSCRLSHIAGVA